MFLRTVFKFGGRTIGGFHFKLMGAEQLPPFDPTSTVCQLQQPIVQNEDIHLPNESNQEQELFFLEVELH